jgi:hypothetical protein
MEAVPTAEVSAREPREPREAATRATPRRAAHALLGRRLSSRG